MKGQCMQPDGAMAHIQVLLNLRPTYVTVLPNEIQAESKEQGKTAADHQPTACYSEREVLSQQCYAQPRQKRPNRAFKWKRQITHGLKNGVCFACMSAEEISEYRSTP